MLKKYLILLASICLSSHPLIGVEKLDEKYLVSFGNASAPVQFIQYFSLSCPHCVQLFHDDFNLIHEEYLKTGQAGYTFHPVPLNEATVQLMECLRHLSASQKVSLLDALFSNLSLDDNAKMALSLMEEAMRLLHQPYAKLQDLNYLKSSQTAQDCVKFLAQDNRISAVPAVEVNGQLYPHQAPTYSYIKQQIIKNQKERP
jgi:protein-disulfide isomerase